MANTRAQKTAQNLSTLTTAGDIAYASAAGTPARLGVGTTGQVLKVSGGLPSWGTDSSGGKVLQVVNATYGTEVSNSTTTYAATGLTATITPSSATSKVLVLVNQTGLVKGTNDTFGHLELRRGATSILKFEEIYARTASAALNNVGGSGCSYLDSPATTSATTYATFFKSESANIVYVNGNGSFSSITLLEIGA